MHQSTLQSLGEIGEDNDVNSKISMSREVSKLIDAVLYQPPVIFGA